MSLAQKYRLQFAAPRGDRFVLWFAAAVAFHLGAVSVSLTLWQRSESLTPETLQAIEFIYLDAPNRASTVDTERRASINTLAAGEQKPVAANPGKPGLETITATLSEPEKPLLPPQVPSEALVPIHSEINSDQNKALEPAPANTVTPTATPIEREQLEPPHSLPSLEPSQPILPTEVSSSVESLPPLAITNSLPDVTPQPPRQLGQGLDGSPNPNRTALGAGGVDAEQEPIWGDYISGLTQVVYQQWQRVAVDTTRESEVRFTIDRRGELSDLQLVQPSGSTSADEAAIQAIQAAAPFEPLPDESPEESLIVNFTFTYNVPPLP